VSAQKTAGMFGPAAALSATSGNATLRLDSTGLHDGCHSQWYTILCPSPIQTIWLPLSSILVATALIGLTLIHVQGQRGGLGIVFVFSAVRLDVVARELQHVDVSPFGSQNQSLFPSHAGPSLLFWPVACSGAMYDGVPITAPVAVCPAKGTSRSKIFKLKHECDCLASRFTGRQTRIHRISRYQ
jgi:hypothetical protein